MGHDNKCGLFYTLIPLTYSFPFPLSGWNFCNEMLLFPFSSHLLSFSISFILLVLSLSAPPHIAPCAALQPFWTPIFCSKQRNIFLLLFTPPSILLLIIFFNHQLPQMDLPPTIILSSSHLHHSFLLPPQFFPFNPPPSTPCCVRRREVYSFVKPAQVAGGGGQTWGGGGGGAGGLLGQIHFQSAIFSFVFLQHFTAI